MRAEKILKENVDVLHSMTDCLMKYETIDAHQIAALMERKDPPPPRDWGDMSDDVSDSDSGSTKSGDAKKTGGPVVGGTAGQH